MHPMAHRRVGTEQRGKALGVLPGLMGFQRADDEILRPENTRIISRSNLDAPLSPILGLQP